MISLVAELCHHRQHDAQEYSRHHRQFDASLGASGPHDFAVRIGAVRYRHLASTASRPAFRDDREPPLRVGRDARIIHLIWVKSNKITKIGISARPPNQASKVGDASRRSSLEAREGIRLAPKTEVMEEA